MLARTQFFLASSRRRTGWNGSWYDALVAVDPFSSETPSRKLLRTIDRELSNSGRLGHDV